MVIDASVARSFAVLGWVERLADAVDGSLLLAHGIAGLTPNESCELRGIRDALEREAMRSTPGSGRASRAIAAMHGIDQLLALGPLTVRVLVPTTAEVELVARLTSAEAIHRAWRHELGMRARRLDVGESVSIAVAHHRNLAFATDDEQALIAFGGLTGRVAFRTSDLLKLLADGGRVDEREAKAAYRSLQEDDLHSLGGPAW